MSINLTSGLFTCSNYSTLSLLKEFLKQANLYSESETKLH